MCVRCARVWVSGGSYCDGSIYRLVDCCTYVQSRFRSRNQIVKVINCHVTDVDIGADLNIDKTRTLLLCYVS